jgi:hypothetical protein
MVLYKSKSDIVGMLASSLCLLHCTLTPFIFIAHTQMSSHDVAPPLWWKVLDYAFLAISFVAVYWSVKNTSKQWIKVAFWITWALLFGVLMNEKAHLLHIPEATIFFPSIGLVLLHLYNKKYCQCKDEECCVPNQQDVA